MFQVTYGFNILARVKDEGDAMMGSGRTGEKMKLETILTLAHVMVLH